MQNPDGGFAYWLTDKGISTICNTVYVLRWLDDLVIRQGSLVERVVHFLFEHHEEDGGWDEMKDALKLDPPELLIPGKTETRVFLTAHCAYWLMNFGYAESPLCKGCCPVDFLIAHKEASGRLVGYLRATWDVLSIFFPLS